MPQRDVSAWDVISQQLPQWWADPQTKDLREGIQAVVPTTPLDLGMMMLGGPTGGMAKKVGAGLMAAGTGDAEAGGLGNLKWLFEAAANVLGRAPTREEMIKIALESNATLQAKVDKVIPPIKRNLKFWGSLPEDPEALAVGSRIQVPTPDQLGKAYDAGFTRPGSRVVTQGPIVTRSDLARTPGMHVAPAGSEQQAIKVMGQQFLRDSNPGTPYPMRPEAQTVVSRMDNPILLTDEAAEFPDKLAAYTGLTDDYRKILSEVRGTPEQKASAITRLLRDHGVDSGIYKNLVERGNKGKNWSHVIFDDSNLELPSNFADGGHVGMEHTRSSGQDASTQPVDSQWRAALRSYLAGTAGLPGDLEGLARQGINAAFGLGGVKVDETPAMPTTEFYKDWLSGKQEGSAPLADAASMLGGAGSTLGVRSLGSLGKAIAHAAPGPVAGGKLAQLGVIRNTGDNNFLKGSVENALKGLKRGIEPSAARDELAVLRAMNGELPRYANADRDILKTESINKFVEGPLTRYVKNQMATPDDPVRALAESGVLHYSPGQQEMTSVGAAARRQAAGFDPVGAAKTNLARGWENVSDMVPLKGTYDTHLPLAEYLTEETKADALRRLGGDFAVNNPHTPVYAFDRGKVPQDLGFDHLTDELRNALNPESGLPRNLLLTPEKLQNFGMEKAVRHVAAINDWREQAALTARKAAAEGIPVRKEHEGGFRWLSVPDTAKDEKALKFACDVGKQGAWCTQGPDLAKRYGSDGNQLHVLVDAKGDPHVQIMTSPVGRDPYAVAFDNLPKATRDQIRADAGVGAGSGFVSHAEQGTQGERIKALMVERYPEIANYEIPQSIVQIKRKANLVNSDPYEYRPFVQDFVKSGKWSDVGDIANTGMVKITQPVDLVPGAKTLEPGMYTQEELTQHLLDSGVPEQNVSGHLRQWGFGGLGGGLVNRQPFATGGRVSMIHPAAAIQPLVRVPGFDRF